MGKHNVEAVIESIIKYRDGVLPSGTEEARGSTWPDGSIAIYQV